MPVGFLRPVGAAADVKEIEYISALHQTEELRADGSIRDNDIVLFLLSRYGIEVTEEQVRRQVIRGLGGGDEEQDDCIDLMEMVCMLLIPTLLKAAAELQDHELPDSLVKPRPKLIDFVLSMILHDTTGDKTPKKLTRRLVQRILLSYGEIDLAENEDLVDEMVQVATDDIKDGELNTEAFARALTQDVLLYDILNEARISTNYDDIFLTKNYHEQEEDDSEDEDLQEQGNSSFPSQSVLSQRKSLSKKLKRRFTAPAIDFVSGTYRSKALVVTMWAAFVITFFGYFGYNGFVESYECPPYQYGQQWGEQMDAMGCAMIRSIILWIITFFAASVYGLIFVGLGSIGNALECRRWYVPIIGIAVITGMILLQYTERDRVDNSKYYLQTTSLVLGLVVIFFHVCHIFAMILPKSWLERSAAVKRFIVTGSLLGEYNMKQSASYKMNLMTVNALKIAERKDRDSVLDSHYGQALKEYAKVGKQFENAGGFVWTWKRVWNKEAFNKEGIWLSARLLACNVTQFIVSAFVLIAGIQLTQRAADNYDVKSAKKQAGMYVSLLFDVAVSNDPVKNLMGDFSVLLTKFLSDNDAVTDSLNGTCTPDEFNNISQLGCEAFLNTGYYACDPNSPSDALCALIGSNTSDSIASDNLVKFGLLNAYGFDAVTMVNRTHAAMQQVADSTVDSLYPTERYMVTIPLALGSIVAFITALSLAITYVPSVTSSTMKLRTGVIATLRDPNFNQYRSGADQVTILTGSMFWGCLIASILVGGVAGVVLFLFLWQATISFTQRMVATAIGIICVVVLKLMFVLCIRSNLYKSFYRTRPATANIASLALECVNFAISVGFVFLRMIKLLVSAALFVGRIDTFFLAPGVGKIGPVELDNYPKIFLKDILAQEAHRHPFLELIGAMYLMKLRYGEHFGKRAGSAWRLLFVHALMPWLNKYRILDQVSDQDGDEGKQFEDKTLEFKDVHSSVYKDEHIDYSKPKRGLQRTKSSGKNLLFTLINEGKTAEVEEENERLKEEVDSLRAEIERLKNEKFAEV